ncbi:Adenylate and Guanylate cyclase catalytic domain-containing protein [Pseudobacteriovorax antillogorgiicola]|uniref:Adenylate and Guanylate cyclase catalytic domain-containing protein n=2 Tax=Pseudobacteriovorax antillogorgiicola TaxID=1513793 RepID=A0A1Y6BQG1_9BACT|nr:adenylate/guanylate cyclase family protein [Pseudobacteriovorax antillogorgiicola]SMF14296.1 Adenylate and Guanylate cyclase catalytic domain-containing protein [Pseudobacteriovorax antillogorgiicola]
MVFTMIAVDVGLGSLTMIFQKVDYMFISAPASLLVCTLLSIRCAWDRYSPAIYLILGWSIFFLGVLASLISLKSGEFNILSYGMVFGFALEICFFSFALGEKVRLAERQAIEANVHAFEQLKKVFYPHQIQQIKAGRELETTMPTGKAKACVLCFDIIESSNIAIPYRDRFLEAGIKRCVKIMDQGYDASQLTARAYRIKEMGDGFLCSVGFPFETGEELGIPSSAVTLAEDFIREFQAHVDEHDLSDQVFCSIGIAFGVIEGRYPVTGAVEYDVYGPAVISANRYERVRKDLFSAKNDCHILTIQDKVYDELSDEQQKEFECLNVETLNYSIHGDRRAKLLYWLERRPSGLKRNQAS